jgi:hypothetical protein
MPCDIRCRHRCARCCARYRYALSSSCPLLCLVICSGSRSLHSSCIVLYRRRALYRRCRNLIVVEGSNVGIYGGGGGDKRADSLEIPRLTTVEVDRSVKVRRDSTSEVSVKRWAHIGDKNSCFPLLYNILQRIVVVAIRSLQTNLTSSS